jgi:hypothetical protein
MAGDETTDDALDWALAGLGVVRWKALWNALFGSRPAKRTLRAHALAKPDAERRERSTISR